MNTAQSFTVFEDADMLRDSVAMLCRDRLPKITGDDVRIRKERDEAVEKFCWEIFSLQGKNFPITVLVEKCSAIIARSGYPPIRLLRAEDLANEISSPTGGW